MKSSRRHFLKAGLAVPLVASAAHSVPTPPEVEGPFYPVVAQKDKDFDLTQVNGREKAAAGEVVIIQGRVLDEKGEPIEEASVDLWQANSFGRYRHPADNSDGELDPDFQGWALVPSGKEGGFRFKTVKPGPYAAGRKWTRPPHIHFKVGKRGYQEITTQMYFPGEALNDTDRLLQHHSPEEQALMIASRVEGQDIPTYNYVIVLRSA